MTRLAGRWTPRAALFAAVLFAFGCSSAGRTMDDVFGGGPNTSTVYGQVVSVDTRSSRMQIREDRGRNFTVRFDNRTRVVGRQRSSSVASLRRGDYVTVRVVQDRYGQAWAERVEVRESVANRGRSTGRTTQVDGSVAWVDARSGSFGISSGLLRASRTVYVPRNISRSERNRLERLRRGDRVRVEVREVGRNEYELVRFR